MKKVLILLKMACINVLEHAAATPMAIEGAPLGKMAKVKFSALVSDMRNKLNGSVFSKNRAGSYLRNKVTPVNPQTSFQTAVRAALTAASQSWKTLLQSERDAWSAAVSSFAKTDIFGDIKNPSGINLYNKLYMNANTIGGAPLTSPPNVVATPGVPDADIAPDSTPQTFTVTSGLANVPASEDWVIRATSNQSPGKTFVKSEYRIVTVIPGGTALPYAGIADYTNKFGAIVAGQKIGWSVEAIDNTTFVTGPKVTGLPINL